MAFSYVFSLFMFFGSLFGGGNDLLDYIPAEAYWKLKATPMTFANMASEVRLADPAAAGNLARAFEASAGADRDRLAAALIDQGEPARTELNRLSHSADADLAARAKAGLEAIDQAPKAGGVRRLMAIRTLGALGKKEAIPLIQPLLKSRESFVAAYAAESIALLENKPAPVRPLPDVFKDDIWRLPADCQAVAQIAPRVAGPELADRVLRDVKLPDGMDRADAIDGLTFTLVEIADRFGNVRFDGITMAASADLGENSGYCIAILRGHYDHATVNRTLSDGRTPFNEFAGGRIYVPGGMAIYAPSDDLLIFAASANATPPVEAVMITAASASSSQPIATQAALASKERLPSTEAASNEPQARLRLKASAEMVKLIASVDTTQPVWLAIKTSEAWRRIPGLASLETLTLTGRPTPLTPLELRLEAKLSDATAARDAAAALTTLLPTKASGAERPGGAGPESSPLLGELSAALAVKAVNFNNDQVNAAATLTLNRADIMRLLLTSMDRPLGKKP